MELVTGTFTVSAAQKAVIDTMRSPHLSLTHFNDETIAVVDVIDDHTRRNPHHRRVRRNRRRLDASGHQLTNMPWRDSRGTTSISPKNLPNETYDSLKIVRWTIAPKKAWIFW